MNLKTLVGSGDKIGLFTLPFILLALGLNHVFPWFFDIGPLPVALIILAAIILGLGVIVWVWSVGLILIKVPKNELITSGPYAYVKHPLYTGVSLLVLPSLGFLFNSWLGLLIGLALYGASRLFSKAEEKILAKTFGRAWDKYCHSVKFPWL